MQQLFSWGFSKKETSEIQEILPNLKQIDSLIKASAPERPLNGINKIDLAILRLSILELIIKKDIPFKVVVDEAVELGKEFGSDSSASFINGVLGKIIDKYKLAQNYE